MLDEQVHGHRCAKPLTMNVKERNDHPEFVPRIDASDILRRLIVDELRNGRLTRGRRRRIVRYCAALGLSAVQAGELIKAGREEVLQSSDPTERYHALRLVEPQPTLIPTAVKIALVIAVAIVVDVMVIRWMW